MAQVLLSSTVMKKAKKRKASRERLPDRASELLINHRILWAVRDELKADIRSIDAKIDSKIGSVEARIHSLDGKIERVIALVEEQNNRNLVVLDGYQSIYDRQDRVEKKVDQLEMTVLEFKKISR
jgi:hypothetical protein